MKLFLVLLFIPFFSIAQSFVPDENGYVKDKKFMEIITKRKYSLVSAFDTIGKTIRAVVIKNDTVKYIDLKLNEFKYIADFKLKNKSAEDSIAEVYNFYQSDLSGRYKTTYNSQGKIGIFDNFKNKQLLKEEFDGVLPMNCGYMFFLLKKNWGVIDTFGRVIIPAKYSNVRPIGLKPFQVDYFVVSDSLSQDLQMIINKQNRIISKYKYTSIYYNYYGERNFVCTRRENNSTIIQLLDLNGNELLKSDYEKIFYNQSMNWFECILKGGNEFDIVNSKGEYLQRKMECDKFGVPSHNVNNFSNHWFVKFTNDPQLSILNLEGKIVLKSNNDIFPLNSEFKYYIKTSLDSLLSRNYVGLIDVNSNVLLPSKYLDLTLLSKSKILLTDKNSKSYFYNLDTKKIDTIKYNIDLNNQWIYNISCTNYVGKHGAINFNNKVIIPFAYSILEKANKYFYTESGVITSTNKLVLEHFYKKSIGFNRFNYRNDFHLINGFFIFDISDTSIEIYDRYNHKITVLKNEQIFNY